MTLAEKTRLDLESFINSEYQAVVGAVGLITGNRQDAADAVQDAIVGYLARPPKQPVENVAAWITVVASNRVRDGYRRHAAESRALNRLEVPDAQSHDVTATLDRDVVEALKSLPRKQRQVCVLHYLLDQSVATIAEGLGVTEGTIKTQLHRARTVLASRLRKEDHHG